MHVSCRHCAWSNLTSDAFKKRNKTKIVAENKTAPTSSGVTAHLHFFASHLQSQPFRLRCCPPLWPRPRFHFCSFFPQAAWSWRFSAPPTWWHRHRRCQTAAAEERREARRRFQGLDGTCCLSDNNVTRWWLTTSTVRCQRPPVELDVRSSPLWTRLLAPLSQSCRMFRPEALETSVPQNPQSPLAPQLSARETVELWAVWYDKG